MKYRIKINPTEEQKKLIKKVDSDVIYARNLFLDICKTFCIRHKRPMTEKEFKFLFEKMLDSKPWLKGSDLLAIEYKCRSIKRKCETALKRKIPYPPEYEPKERNFVHYTEAPGVLILYDNEVELPVIGNITLNVISTENTIKTESIAVAQERDEYYLTFITDSDIVDPVTLLKVYKRKIRKLERRLKNKEPNSNNYNKQKKKIEDYKEAVARLEKCTL